MPLAEVLKTIHELTGYFDSVRKVDGFQTAFSFP